MYAEKDTNKFGKITDEEVKMNVFAPDTTAVAVVLYEKGQVYYQINQGFEVCYEVYVKMKILKPEGTKYGTVEVSYRDFGNGSREHLEGIDGYSYNYVNGKIEKSRLSKDYIFTEDVDGKIFRKKLSIPNVKPGSLIEYKYTVVSDFEQDIPSWTFQRSIPVCQSIYDVTIPEYYTFHMNTKGYNTIETVKEPVNQTFVLPGGAFPCTCNHYNMRVRDLPALKKDGYVSYMSDYLSGVTFEISGVQVPGYIYKSYSYTWNDVEKQLIEYGPFGSNLKKSGLFKEEVKQIAATQLTPVAKISAIMALVRAKIKWNDKEQLYTEDVKNAVKTGIGNSADMNYALICMLKDAGLDAYPVVMSKKSDGRLPISRPTIDGINYFVVGVTVDTLNYYMDASRKNAPVNVLDEDFLVDRAYAVRGVDSHLSGMVDLSHLTNSMERDLCLISFVNNKMLIDVTTMQNNQLAYQFRQKYKSYKNQDEYIESLQSDRSATIDNYTLQGLDSIDQPIVEKYTISKSFPLTATVYFNPLTVFRQTVNPFKEEKRILPVEFDFPYSRKYTISVMLPAGYTIDEAPKSERMSIKERDAQFSYLLQKQESSFQMVSTVAINQLIYPLNDYSNLRDFWTHMIAKNNEQVVLKKTEM
jgi:hypothetical protein